jgi:hypothetical protein
MYRLEARIIGRSQGKSAVKQAAHNTGKRSSAVRFAAYLSRSELTDERTGKTWDYSRHFGGAGAILLTPANTPEWLDNRHALWNQVEAVERRKDAMLARDFIMTMPYGLSQKQMFACAAEFAKEQFVSQGKPVDIGLHIYGEPWGARAKVTEEKIAEWEGWKYPFFDVGQVPPDYHGPHIGVERWKNGNPRNYYLYQPHIHMETPFRTIDPASPTGLSLKKETVTLGNWHTIERAKLKQLRKDWADALNRHLEAAGLEERVDHRSIEDRGIKGRKPEPKKGPVAAKMEREDRGDQSHAIKDWKANRYYNAESAKLNAESGNINSQILAFLDDCLKSIKSGHASMELTPGQSHRRDDDVTNKMEQIDKTTEAVSAWWMDHQRQMAANAEEQKKKERDVWRQPLGEEIADAKSRWAQACDVYGNMRDPDSSMAAAARAEGAQFRKEQETLRQAEARESDPAKRELLQLRRHIEASEYMALTSERMEGVSKFLSGRPGSESEEYYKAEAGKYREIAAAEREKMSELRELMDGKNLDKLHEGLKDMEKQDRADPFLRRMNRVQPVPEKDQSFGVPQDLPTNAPNRDRPQNDQRPPPGQDHWRDVRPEEVFEPGRKFRMDQTTGASQVRESKPRDNPYDAMASRDQERRDAGKEKTDTRKQPSARDIQLRDRLNRNKSQAQEEAEERDARTERGDGTKEVTDQKASLNATLKHRIDQNNQEAARSGREEGGRAGR